MSQAAEAYYQTRADRLHAQVPPVLDGRRHVIMPPDAINPYTNNQCRQIARRITKLLDSVEPYVGKGLESLTVRLALGDTPARPTFRRLTTASNNDIAGRLVADHFKQPGQMYSLGCYLEAFAREEMPQTALRRISDHARLLGQPAMEDVQAYLVLHSRAQPNANREPVPCASFILSTISPYKLAGVTTRALQMPLTSKEQRALALF